MSSETKREITYLEALREAMVQEMRADQEVFLIGEDVGTYGGAFGVSKGMLEEFPFSKEYRKNSENSVTMRLASCVAR